MASYIFDRETMTVIPRDEFYAKQDQRRESKRATSVALPYIRGDLPAYKSPATGRIIEGRAARREDLARSGCREVDPSEYKPTYKNYAFCQKHRRPYMGGDVPPPMTRDEKAAATERRAKQKAIEAAHNAKAAAKANAQIDPALARFARGNTKSAPIFKNNSVRNAD